MCAMGANALLSWLSMISRRDVVALVGNDQLLEKALERYVGQGHLGGDVLLSAGRRDSCQHVARTQRRRLGHQLLEAGEPISGVPARRLIHEAPPQQSRMGEHSAAVGACNVRVASRLLTDRLGRCREQKAGGVQVGAGVAPEQAARFERQPVQPFEARCLHPPRRARVLTGEEVELAADVLMRPTFKSLLCAARRQVACVAGSLVSRRGCSARCLRMTLVKSALSVTPAEPARSSPGLSIKAKPRLCDSR